MPTSDDPQEQEGEPGLYTPPPGQDIETDQDAAVSPSDRPLVVEGYGTTAAEEVAGESVGRRFQREEPEVSAADIDGREDSPLAGRLLDPDSDIDGLDDTAEAVAFEGEDDDAGLSAEESAMHIVGEDEASDSTPGEEASGYFRR